MPSAKHRAFTLLELLVVVAIIGMLIALLLPAVQAARESARRTQCSSNLKQWALGTQSYHAARKSLPYGSLPATNWTWRAALLPYVEENVVYQLINYSHSCIADNQTLPLATSPCNKPISIAICPSDANGALMWQDPAYGQFSLSSYLGNEGTNPAPAAPPYDGVLFAGGPVRFAKVTDGLSTTLLAGERGIPNDAYWGFAVCGVGSGDGTGDGLLSTQTGFGPGSPIGETDVFHYWSQHAGGGQFALVDGSVHFLDYAIDPQVFAALGTRSGDELVDKTQL